MDDNEGKQSVWSFVYELEKVVELMKLYAEIYQVELVYSSTAEDDISFKGDRTMVRFALINLIKNAIEACDPKGHVNICLHEMMKEIYIVIEDNGIVFRPCSYPTWKAASNSQSKRNWIRVSFNV